MRFVILLQSCLPRFVVVGATSELHDDHYGDGDDSEASDDGNQRRKQGAKVEMPRSLFAGEATDA